MSSKGIKRLEEEFSELRKGGLSHVGGSAGPINRNFKHWRACFIGPKRTPYENGLFYVEMVFDDNYPDTKPKVRFKTKVFHPNIYSDGSICIDYLNNWKEQKIQNIRSIIDALFELLCFPNFGSRANTDCTKENYEQKASECRSQNCGASQNYVWNYDTSWKPCNY